MNDHKKLVTDVFTTLAKGNGELVESELTEDFTSTVMKNPVDRKQFIRAFSGLHKGIPDLQVNLHDIEEKGNKIRARLNLSGTHSAELPELVPGFKKLSPSGRRVSAENVELEISLTGDKIREIRSVQRDHGVFSDVYSQLST